MREVKRQPNRHLLLVCRDTQPRTAELAGGGRVHLLPKHKTPDAWWLRCAVCQSERRRTSNEWREVSAPALRCPHCGEKSPPAA